MSRSLILLLLLTLMVEVFAKQDWEPCGLPSECYCSRPILTQIHCPNISVFPTFDDVIKPGVLSVAIYDSNIVGIPPFKKEEWDRLEQLSFVGTPLLMCNAIAEIKRPGLHIFSECLCPPEKECPEEIVCPEENTCPKNKETSTLCLASLVVLIFLVVLAMGVIHALLLHDTTLGQDRTQGEWETEHGEWTWGGEWTKSKSEHVRTTIMLTSPVQIKIVVTPYTKFTIMLTSSVETTKPRTNSADII